MEEYAKTILISPDAYTFGIVQYAGYMGCGLYKLDRIRELDYWAGMSHQCTCIWLMPHGLMEPAALRCRRAKAQRGEGPGLRRRHQGHEAQRKAPAPARGLHP